MEIYLRKKSILKFYLSILISSALGPILKHVNFLGRVKHYNEKISDYLSCNKKGFKHNCLES